MTEDKVTFLTEVELPPYCFMSEAVEWLAYGRVPQMQHHMADKTYEILDFRFYWREMPDNFQPGYVFPWFDRLEFESLGIPMPEGYLEAAERCYEESVSDLPRMIKEYEGKQERYVEHEDGTVSNFYQEFLLEHRKKLETLGPLQILVDQAEIKFRPYFGVAFAKLFQLLALAEISEQHNDAQDRLLPTRVLWSPIQIFL